MIEGDRSNQLIRMGHEEYDARVPAAGSAVTRHLRLVVAAVMLAATAVSAQSDAPGGRHRIDVPYDGRFTFVRLRWQSGGLSPLSR